MKCVLASRFLPGELGARRSSSRPPPIQIFTRCFRADDAGLLSFCWRRERGGKDEEEEAEAARPGPYGRFCARAGGRGSLFVSCPPHASLPSISGYCRLSRRDRIAESLSGQQYTKWASAAGGLAGTSEGSGRGDGGHDLFSMGGAAFNQVLPSCAEFLSCSWARKAHCRGHNPLHARFSFACFLEDARRNQ